MQLHQRQLGAMHSRPSRQLSVAAKCQQLPSQPKRDVSAAVGSTSTAPAAPAAGQCPVKRIKSALNGTLLSTAPEGIASAKPVPGPSFVLPFVGETFEYSEKGPLRFGLERTRKYGPIFKTSLWGSEMVMVTEMELFKAVMEEDSELVQFNTQGSFAKLQGDFATNILANKDGARMPFRRSMLAAMTSEAMAGYMPKIWSIAKEQVAELAARDTWELNAEARKWGMSFANSLLAGLEGLTEEQAKALRTDLGIFFDGLITFDVDLPGTPLRKGFEAKERLLTLIRASVERQKDEILKEGAPSAPGVKVRKNMMGYLIDNQRAAGEEINVDFLSTMALGVLQAGTDTSSAGFNGLVVILAQMPDVMERIRQEQREVQAKYGDEVSKQAIDAMKYTDAVVREALRINTPGLAQFRVPLRDFTLGGYYIPKGLPLFLNVVTSHALELAPDWAADPASPLPPSHMDLQQLRTSFKPERWLDPNPENRPSLLTFGHGPHTCVGIQLYINEAKSIVAALARGYDLQLLTPKIEWQEFPTIKPKHDVFLRITPHKA